MAKAYHKPLSFSTTMRSPDRIAKFIKCLLPYEHLVLTNEIIMQIVYKIIRSKEYRPNYILEDERLKAIYYNEDEEFSDEDLRLIVENSPQQHKEAGFDMGWPSRFDTWFKLPMEFGFIYYEMGSAIKISDTGHMLIDALNEVPVNGEKIQNVFLNAMMKYQTKNPFRKNLSSNVPLILLLQLIKKLKEDSEENDAGVFIQELPLIICWPDSDIDKLYNTVKNIRKEKGFLYSNDYMYEVCLKLLNAEDQRKRFKKNQITGEAVDEFIRKMRITGVVSLRGQGRFIDFNMFEIDRINYILDNYSEFSEFSDKEEFYNYIGTIDERILSLPHAEVNDADTVRKEALKRYAEYYSSETIYNELKNLSTKKDSKDTLLKTIPEPVRLEFLTSIALKQKYDNLEIHPNYNVDDEGIPTFTAAGGRADIVCFDDDYNSLFEVTLMRSRQQANDEILPINRHLLEAKGINANTFSVFIAPVIHPDAAELADFLNHKYDNIILTYSITDFLNALDSTEKVSELINI